MLDEDEPNEEVPVVPLVAELVVEEADVFAEAVAEVAAARRRRAGAVELAACTVSRPAWKR